MTSDFVLYQQRLVVHWYVFLNLLCRPDLIDFDKLKKSNANHNLQNAFNLAEQHLGLTKLLDPEGEKTNYYISGSNNNQTVHQSLRPCWQELFLFIWIIIVL